MSTQQDIYAAGSKNRPPMLNKENYVPWSSRLLRYAKSRPNGKLIHNSIINGPYVRRMIPEPGDTNREVPVNETFHVQTDDELTEKELKQIEADDQAIQTILLGLFEDIYVAVDKWSRHVTIVHQTKDLHTADYTQLYDFLKYNQKEVDDLKAERLARTQDPLALIATSNNPYTFLVLHQDQPSFNQNYMQQPIQNPEDITDPTTAMNMALALMAKAFKLNYSTPTNNNQRISSNPRNRQIAQPGNLNGYNDVQNVRNQVIQNAVQNPRIQNAGNQNGLIGVPGNANQNPNGNGNLVAARAEGNTSGHNGNQIRCYNCRGLGRFARNYTVRPRRRDAAYLQTQLLIAQKEEAGIQLQVEEFDLMAAAADLDEIEEVNANCILMANLQQASTSGTQTDKAPVYDPAGSAEYTELLKPIPEPHQVPHNDNNVISEGSSVEQSGGTVEQHPANVEETRVLYDSLYNNLAIKVEKVNTVNRKLSETNTELTTELARYKNQEKCFEISQEKYDKLERCYQKSVYQEQCLSKKINALHLSSSKQIMTLNEEISGLNKQLSVEKSTVSSLLEEKKKLKSDFRIREDELLNKQTQLEKKIKELDNILVTTDFKSLAKEADESLANHKALELEIERLLRAVVLNYAKENAHLKTTYKNLFDSISVTQTQTKTIIDSLQNKLNDTIYENAKLRAQLFDMVSDQKDTSRGMSENTKFVKQSILRKPPKVGETHALSKPVTSNSIPTPQGSKVMKNDKVIAPGMFRINPFKTSREEKHVPNKVRASVRTNSITVSQPPIITKKVVNSDSNGFSSTRIDNTKTRRPQPRSNTKNDRVPSTSKSSCSKNKEVDVEEHHRKLLLSRKKKHMSSECNNVKLATQNVKSKVVCAMCKQCLISVNHDLCLLNYVNDMTSRGKKQKANVSINENQKKQKSKVKKPKKVGSIERLASPKPSKPRSFLRWLLTGRLFDLKGKIITSSESESQSDCSKGDNACTSNPMEPTIKQFPNSTFSLSGYPNMFMFLGTVRFENDHIAAIMGFSDLQWGNILITRVYFVKGLGHNLFLVGQFCDSKLEVAFRRNTCFVRNLEGVDLLKGNHITNLYTINLHEMASASLICLMAHATSTKSWLWHQRLSHLNFDIINDLAKNDIVFGLLKFKYHKEHFCPSCEQGKSKRAYHPPKPVPN
nr:hypothetical protein [Tanacetum cinerariifolium]